MYNPQKMMKRNNSVLYNFIFLFSKRICPDISAGVSTLSFNDPFNSIMPLFQIPSSDC